MENVMYEDNELRLTSFDYAVNVLSKPEISMHLKDTNLDVFELADKIYNYLKNGKQ